MTQSTRHHGGASRMLRKLAVPLILVVACSVAVSAQGGGQGRLVLSPAQFKVLFGHELTLSGTLGGGRPGQRITIDASPYGPYGATTIGSAITNAKGQFSFRAKPRIETTYQAHTSAATSNPVTVGVAPALAVSELGNGHIWARVVAGKSFSGRIVKLQALRSRSWVTVAQKHLSTASIAVFTPSLPTATVRITMSVNEAGAGYLAASSDPFVYKPSGLTIAAPNAKVLFGHKLLLSGRLLNGRAGQRILIEAWPYGASAPFKLAAVKTVLRGAWSLPVSPMIQTTYRASWASAQTSAPFVLGVRPVLTIQELGNGSVAAHVSAGRSLVGRLVKLQTLALGGKWLTVAQRPLDLNSKAVFAVSLPDTAIRVAMSVNQAGAGLLGTMSNPLAYHKV
jgi:hypothetical protein